MDKDKIITLSALVVFLLIIIAIVINGIKRKKILEKDFVVKKARITKVILNTPKGTTSRKNVALYIYKYKGKNYVKTVEIYNIKVKKNTCYEIKVSNINPDINKILLDKKVKCDEEN
ncbi:hypothetical protein [Tenacibaculum sp. 190524A02b]|uniref:hypothetical protein n=1 Tax=Tenacibaculum vairaonense TaxID=3137860 RepID=UPI0031FB40EA